MENIDYKWNSKRFIIIRGIFTFHTHNVVHLKNNTLGRDAIAIEKKTTTKTIELLSGVDERVASSNQLALIFFDAQVSQKHVIGVAYLYSLFCL